ncbi:hypothetical protein LWI28_007888 [Acer negundo]|uniref:Uncharacterized protein n=1 Tax=Acer negundo TaxID=4023 RepID=A0AAD5IDP4_ACENE|nr:hypothetical protein LWI28_007888 [Acer negundo]
MERPEMRKLQKEQERERRRLRDRQRRQSMSVEEREKHLARRRRNYQLRRLRAENARLDFDPQTQSQSQSQPTTPPTDQIPPLNSVSDLSLQCTNVGSHQECTKSESLEVPAHKLTSSLGSCDVTVKGLEASNGISPKGISVKTNQAKLKDEASLLCYFWSAAYKDDIFIAPPKKELIEVVVERYGYRKIARQISMILRVT